jgi:F-type H+/Na+-transporting ATPase subunit alpha
MSAQKQNGFSDLLEHAFDLFGRTLKAHRPRLGLREMGTVKSIGRGVAVIEGLDHAQAEEMVLFPDNVPGMILNLDPGELGVIMLGQSDKVRSGSAVFRTGRVMDVPVGENLLGRVVDAAGRPLDSRGPVRSRERRPIEREAAAIMERDPVTVPLQTGLKVVDALIPIGRGQRELILGDRQTGKTAIALDTIINQRDKNVLCVYCAIGQRSSAVSKLIADLRDHQAMEYTIVVNAAGEDPPGMRFIAPYAATTMAEYFMEQGRDVLIVYDDLTHHARAYRELSLLLRRPPGREAFPGDIFYIHSRLLERATHLRRAFGGGSLSALPIVETEAQNVAAYIPTNIISITDGQIYLSPELFQKGMLPAVDVGKSVSRVGGKTQLPSYRMVAGDLRLSYSQFEELEKFARFSTRLDEKTRKSLERGRRVREVLKQKQYQPLSASRQIAVLLAVNSGLLDELPLEQLGAAQEAIQRAVATELPEMEGKIQAGQKLADEDRQRLLETIAEALRFMASREGSGRAES